ncbi:SGNH/GDSL hydrolase family protein [Microlunatus sp. GCM10028923]|uniref:SGNH/GDSL hydrolase family protein n=1 Tax=Microlunatus sp. GCM10028923 TaxID=3273400 RepID=UPI0036202C2F
MITMTVLLLGDSNLAQLNDGLPDLVTPAFGADAECRAAGGAWSGSLRQQLGDRKPSDYDAIVVSIGSSDSHPSKGSSPTIFRENLSRELERGGRWIALLPRSLAGTLDPAQSVEEVNALIRVYRAILEELINASGGIALDTGAITESLGPEAYDTDGVHLTRAAYEELVPEVAKAIDAVSQRP